MFKESSFAPTPVVEKVPDQENHVEFPDVGSTLIRDGVKYDFTGIETHEGHDERFVVLTQQGDGDETRMYISDLQNGLDSGIYVKEENGNSQEKD